MYSKFHPPRTLLYILCLFLDVILRNQRSETLNIHFPYEKKEGNVPSGHSQSCYSAISMGDRFIQIGMWRLADIDGTHFSVSHKWGQVAVVYKSDGTVHPGPLSSDFSPWGRSSGDSKHIAFGFQFIQIGEFRIGAVDGTHFSVSHRGGKTAQIFRSDITLHPGPRTDYSTFDRPADAASGVSFGKRFIQIGEFRFGDVDGNHFTMSHSGGNILQVYKSDGRLNHGVQYQTADDIETRRPAAWTCQSLEASRTQIIVKCRLIAVQG